MNPEIVPHGLDGVWGPRREPSCPEAEVASGQVNFEQDADLDAYEWEPALYDFVRLYRLNFIKLELLLLFYRAGESAVKAQDIVTRTGYHPGEIAANLAQLVSQRLIRSDEQRGYSRLEDTGFAGRGLLRQMLDRLVAAFKEREGRLRIIYALLKAREAQE